MLDLKANNQDNKALFGSQNASSSLILTKLNQGQILHLEWAFSFFHVCFCSLCLNYSKYVRFYSWNKNLFAFFITTEKLPVYLGSYPELLVTVKTNVTTEIFNFNYNTITFWWRRSQSYRNQYIDLLCKSMDRFLYDRDLRHERVNYCVHRLTFILNFPVKHEAPPVLKNIKQLIQSITKYLKSFPCEF